MKREVHTASSAVLTPLSFFVRAVKFLGERTAIIHGEKRYSYREFGDRVTRLAGALSDVGIGEGDKVAILAPNIPAMLEAHFAVPMIGAVLNPINFRLDEEVVSAFLQDGEARLLICDSEFFDLGCRAAEALRDNLPIIVVNDDEVERAPADAYTDYEDFIASAPAFDNLPLVDSEYQPIALLYTSGTTGTPKSVVYSHRGTYLAALSNALSFGLTPESIYLWTWPMFHSNGLSFVWAVTAVGGTHVCTRSIDPKSISSAIVEQRVSHFCAAPLVLKLLASDPAMREAGISHPVNCITGGSPPPPPVLDALEKVGLTVTHQYGASECYGPATIAMPEHGWDELSDEQRHLQIARQGVPTAVVDDLMVAEPGTLQPVPRDGHRLGEVLLRGSVIADVYRGSEAAAGERFIEDWYRTGDIAAWHQDGSIEIKDRTQDMIISGGENLSSVEIENVLYKHPDVSEAAVVAKPHQVLQATPLAFIDPVEGATLDAQSLRQHCEKFLPESKIPREFLFRALPKTATGKIQKHVLREIVLAQSA